jgi:histidyl-tRNA synthetase
MAQFRAIRGMNDILPSEMPYWHHLEQNIRNLVTQYGYHEIRMPIVESTDLFHRSIGEVTDIVEKEMYSFKDRHDDKSLSLRPEGTAGCVRAVIEHGLTYHKTQKLWYIGPLFRHERPQRGRYRQFFQVGLETFGFPGADIEAELLLMVHRLWKNLNIDDLLQLEINTLGTLDSRQHYRQALVDYFNQYKNILDEDCLRRLSLNPLRILDSKNPALTEIISKAPVLTDYLDGTSRSHFENICFYLQDNEIPYILNPRLVRGLDYYSDTVFEWTTSHIGAQSAVGGGGRYDMLVELLGGPKTPAFGLALGCERIIELLKIKCPVESFQVLPHAYLVLQGETAPYAGFKLAEKIRGELPDFRLICHCGGGNVKNQFKRADQSGAQIAIILGEEELKTQRVAIKFLREERPQDSVDLNHIISYLKNIFSDRKPQ